MLKFSQQVMVDDPNNINNVIIKGPCVITGEEYQVSVPAIELAKWSAGGLAQDVLISLTAEQREFLISCVSPEGWKTIFGEEVCIK